MKIDLNKYDIPEIIEKDGKLQIYDKLKGIYRVVSPDERSEEYVRQKTIEYLKHELNINYEAIDIEESEAHYHDNNQRMDLLVSGMSDKKELLMVVECKAETVELTQDVYIQAKGYAERLNIPVIMITNGLEVDFLKKDDENNYEQITKPPTYEELLDYTNIKTQPIPEYSYDRYTYEELFDSNIQEQEIYMDDSERNKAIHIYTRKELIPYILNFRDCLLDTSHKIDNLSLGKYNFVEDLGVFYRKIDNTGGKFVGNFRSLAIEIDGNIEIINLLITPYMTDSGRTDTVMMIALNDAEIQWIRFDRFAVLENKTLKFYDDGSTSTRNMGPIKRDLILDYIKENSNIAVNDENMVVLGQIDMSNLLYADNPEFKNVLENCIEFALLKQEKRKEYQENYIPKAKDEKQLPEGIQKDHVNKIIKKNGVKKLDDDAMEFLINYLNDISIDVTEMAIEEAEKVNHRIISVFDMLRAINRIFVPFEEKYDDEESIVEDYEEIEEFISNEYFFILMEDLFETEEERNAAEKNKFWGIYTFTLYYSEFEKVNYEFVYATHFFDDNNEVVALVPRMLPDLEILRYFHNVEEDEDLPAELGKIQYTAYDKSSYNTTQKELVSFEGNIRKINDDDFYVTDNGINYQIMVPEERDCIQPTGLYLSFEDLVNQGIDINEIIDDDFMGKYEMHHVTNTGEQFIKSFVISSVEDEGISFDLDDSLERNVINLPSIIQYADKPPIMVSKVFDYIYVPHN